MKNHPTLDDLRSKAVPLLKPYVRRISVFGSLARGKPTPDSDIDLLVELKPAGQRPMLGFKWFRLENELSELFGRKIDMISEAELGRHLKPFVEKDRVLLYEEKRSPFQL
jgi:predicted nucleotidyltransferase